MTSGRIAEAASGSGSAGDRLSATVKSALRVLLVIELLTDEPTGLSFAQICQRLRLPKSSTHALLRTMKERGHLDLDETGRYRLGIRIWQAGQAHTQGFDLAAAGAARTSRWRETSYAETVQLAVLDGFENVYLAKEDSDQRLVLQSRVGPRLPAYATGLGKVLLSGLSDDEVLAGLSKTALHAFTTKTISNPAALLAALQKVRQRGYAIDHGEYTEGVICVAVPVRDHRGTVMAAISVSVPEIRTDLEFQQRALEVLTREATNLSGFSGIPNRRLHQHFRTRTSAPAATEARG